MGSINLSPLPPEDLKGSDNLLQSGFWGRVKEQFGQKALAFHIEGGGGNGEETVPLLVLLRKYAPGMTLAYTPHGPQSSSSDRPEVPPEEPGEYLREVTEALLHYLPRNCVFLRFDLPWRMSDDYVGFLGIHPPFTKAPVDIQPPSTVILDLEKKESDILGQMKSKTRYNIRLAGKKGVRIREGESSELDAWYEMYLETAKRDRIAIHGKEYYTAPFRLAETFPAPRPELRLFLASVDNIDAAGIIVATFGKRAIYLYGASNNYKRNYMPAYALQWHAITWAKQSGCTSYDFFGIPPTNDPDHPMHGLFRFKTGFGGEIVHRFGCWDYPVKPVLYNLSGSGEKIRDFYYKKVRKR